MKDWCVITGACGPHSRLLEQTSPTMRRYAEVMDMDYAGYELGITDLPPSWEKILLLSNKLDAGYEGVLWVDADAEFLRFDEDVRTLVRPGWNWVHNRYVGKPWPCVPCAGVVAVTPEAQETLDLVWELRYDYRDHGWWEQQAALTLFGWNPDTGELTEPEGQHELPARWNSTPESPAEDPVIYHASTHDGSTIDKRLDLLIHHADELG